MHYWQCWVVMISGSERAYFQTYLLNFYVILTIFLFGRDFLWSYTWFHPSPDRLRLAVKTRSWQYGAVTMIVPASGHQVRCIPWVQMGTFNKKIGFFMWTKILCIEYILWGMPTIESTFDVANMVKTATVKDVPINHDALLNIQACWIHVWENGICSPIW